MGTLTEQMPVERLILIILFGFAVCALVAYVIWLFVRACQRAADQWALRRTAELTSQVSQAPVLHPQQLRSTTRGVLKKKKVVTIEAPDDDGDEYGAEGDGVVIMDD